MANGTRIDGSVWVEDPKGTEREWRYHATLQPPVRGAGDVLEIAFTAEVDDLEDQPGMRLVIIRGAWNLVDAAFLRRRVEAIIVEHIEEVQT